MIDPGVESAALDSGRWLEESVEQALVADAFDLGAAVAVMPYGAFRLTRATVDEADPGHTWATATELHLPPGPRVRVVAPTEARVTQRGAIARFALDLTGPDDGQEWVLEVSGLDAEERRERPVDAGRPWAGSPRRSSRGA